jgi:hypothetical protein
MEGHPILLKPAILFVHFQQGNRSNYCEKENTSITKYHAYGSEHVLSDPANVERDQYSRV